MTSDEEEDTDRSEVDDPSSDNHHGVRKTREKIQQRFSYERMTGMIGDRIMNIFHKPFSPSLARDTPRMIAKVMRPRILEPAVHSPEGVNTTDKGRICWFTFELPSERISRVPPLVGVVHVSRAVVVLALRLDQSRPVLLHGGLHDVGGDCLSDEVHQGVRGGDVTGVESLVALRYVSLTFFLF